MNNIIANIKKLIFSKKFNTNQLPIEFKGNNWLLEKEKSILILFNFNPWKRKYIHQFFPEHRVVFVRGKKSWISVKNNFINKLDKHEKLHFATWGKKKIPFGAKIYKIIHSIKMFEIEDGFLRSIGSGLLHTKPFSLCVDSRSIYFDAKNISSLENLLSTYNFKENKTLMERAKFIIELAKNANLTKYYDVYTKNKTRLFTQTKQYSILIVGQVEKDASIIFGKTKIRKNIDLIKQAKRDFPAANLYFKPHPDTINKVFNTKISKLCTILPSDINLEYIFNNIDHIYTMTSLVGFEALIRGKKVTTFGLPFYSNWGLTDDRVKLKRRRHRKLSLEELVVGVYLLYPKYIHPDSDQIVEFEEIASYFIIEVLKEKNIFQLDKKDNIFISCESQLDALSTPCKIIKLLNQSKTHGLAESDKFFSILNSNFLLRDYPQISYMLIKTANFDILQEYSNQCILYLEKNIETIYRDTTLLNSFLYSLTLAQKNMNGRVLISLANINDYILKIPNFDDNIFTIYVNYIVSLLSNLEYEIVKSFLHQIEKITSERIIKVPPHSLKQMLIYEKAIILSSSFYKKISIILAGKATRSERFPEKRNELYMKTTSMYLKLLNDTSQHFIHLKIHYIQYQILLDNMDNVVKLLSAFYESIDNIQKVINDDKYKNYFYTFIEKLLQHGKINAAADLLLKIDITEKVDAWYAYLQLYSYVQQRSFPKFYKYLSTLSHDIKENEKIKLLLAQVMRREGQLASSKKIYFELFNTSKTLARRFQIKEQIEKLDFLEETSRILNIIPQPKLPKGVIFLSSQTCFDSLALITPVLVGLKRKGYALINLTEGMTEEQPTGIDFLDKFQGSIPIAETFHKDKELTNEWRIDWENKIVESNGINFYQGFYERISTFTRQYHIDINMPLASKTLKYNLRRADNALNICKHIYSETILKRNFPTIIISGNTHIVPYSIMRDFSMHVQHPKLSFINFNVAYESYFSNVGSKFASTMAVTDMTLYPTIRAPFFARKDKFESWYYKNQNNKKYLDASHELIRTNRVGNKIDEKTFKIIDYLKTEKEKGKKILCAFGKVPVDLGVPFDGGPAHDNMAEWINNTIDICNDNKDIILLIKPHPHELKPEISLDLVEKLRDLIKIKMSNNVIFLGHKDINGHQLAPYLDLAILYNGSTALELTALGIPVIMTSYFGKYDYPIDLIYPEDKQNYKNFLLSLKYPTIDISLRKKAALLIIYMGTDEVSLKNMYSKRRVTNDGVGIPTWRQDLIEKFIQNGDEYIDKAVEIILEKLENQSNLK